MSDLVTTYIGVVYPWHHDQMGHMNVQHYVGMFDGGTWNLFAQVGLTSEWMKNNDRGMAAVQMNISYRREMTSGDLVEVRSGFLNVSERKVMFVHEMINRQTGDVAAVAEITGVMLDSVKRKSALIPQENLDRAKELIVEYDFGRRS
jgi:acyl-CoA thioester hydrolase